MSYILKKTPVTKALNVLNQIMSFDLKTLIQKTYLAIYKQYVLDEEGAGQQSHFDGLAASSALNSIDGMP